MDSKFKTLFDYSPDSIIVVDSEGIINNVNIQTEKIFGYKALEIIGQQVEALIPERFRERHFKHIANYFKNPTIRQMGTGMELLGLRKDKTEFFIEIMISPLGEVENKMGMAIVRDITHRKKTEELLRESEEKHRLLFNSIDEGFCIIEMIFDEQQKPVDYRFLAINESFERQTGLVDAVGKRMREFAPNHEDHWFETYGKIALTGESIRFENRAEQLHRWYDVYAFRFGDPKNLQVAILFNDITSRKQTEEQLMAVNKELESFSYSVSHDLRAPLRAIGGYAKVLEEDHLSKLDESGARALRFIMNNSIRMGELIDNLLSFSRLGRKEVTVSEIDMTAMVRIVKEELVTEEMGAQIEFEERILLPAKGDKVLIKQVWVNLISNAIKYSSHRVKSIIETGADETDGFIVYYVKDNGVGFDMRYYDKLFGVFQRLHSQEEFDGTGIGLANVQKIIHRHHGAVWAESKLNEGATFYFSLPR